ncbi:MAG: hypothetical protein BWX80_04216 [Candidatus Hydrogenedentes bacterium ADurb.Bin101]|nr:MAG: hypothetical protein BWX80_04216 [Candidatus Hydrogenedentes bacterium ADurb.Bin101]
MPSATQTSPPVSTAATLPCWTATKAVSQVRPSYTPEVLSTSTYQIPCGDSPSAKTSPASSLSPLNISSEQAKKANRIATRTKPMQWRTYPARGFIKQVLLHSMRQFLCHLHQALYVTLLKPLYPPVLTKHGGGKTRTIAEGQSTPSKALESSTTEMFAHHRNNSVRRFATNRQRESRNR